MKKIFVPGFVAGLVNLVVGVILSQFYNFVSPAIAGEYTNIALFRLWSDPLMSLFFLYPFVLGLVLAWVWDETRKLFEGKSAFERACKFGFAYWIAATVPGMFITYSSFQVSLGLVLSWTLTGLVEAIVAGWIFAKMMK